VLIGISTWAVTVEHVACTLLRLYGVVFWRLLAREKAGGCRHGANCCASIAAWKRAGKLAAAVSSPVSPANNTPC
jgi:hypothetical protein